MPPDAMATASRDLAAGAVTVLEGDAALAWLESAEAREKLDALHARCPWATCFQGRDFLEVWYRCYREVSEPVLLYREDGGRLTGFLPLARHRDSGRLVAAGDHQAEYQGWLADPEDGDAFLDEALVTLKRCFRPDVLRLRYLPAGTPLGWLERPLASGATVTTRRHRRPLLSLADPKAIADSLRKKGNKSRLNRLKRLGEVAFRRLADRAELEAVIDEIIHGYDLRQGAANGVCPFTDDPLKRRFHLELMARPGLMQASVLTVGGRIAAAHLGLHDGHRDGASVVVGVFGHAPAFGQHSPGKFLMLMMGEALAEDGTRQIDLTPGGAWKDRFASDHDEVVEATVFFRPALARRHRAAETALAAARGSLALVGKTPDDARRFAERLRRGDFLGRGEASDQTPAPLVYVREVGDPTEAAGVMRDRHGDLLRIEPMSEKNRQAFLAAAEAHLERGHRLYSQVENNRLAGAIWLLGEDTPAGCPDLPERTAWIEAARFDPACLQALLADLDGRAERVAIAVPAGDQALRRQVEKTFSPWPSARAHA